MKKMNDRHRAVTRARIRYERRKYEHNMDGFAKALYPVFKAAATTIKQWPAVFSGKQKARLMRDAPEVFMMGVCNNESEMASTDSIAKTRRISDGPETVTTMLS